MKRDLVAAVRKEQFFFFDEQGTTFEDREYTKWQNSSAGTGNTVLTMSIRTLKHKDFSSLQIEHERKLSFPCHERDLQ